MYIQIICYLYNLYVYNIQIICLCLYIHYTWDAQSRFRYINLAQMVRGQGLGFWVQGLGIYLISWVLWVRGTRKAKPSILHINLYLLYIKSHFLLHMDQYLISRVPGVVGGVQQKKKSFVGKRNEMDQYLISRVLGIVGGVQQKKNRFFGKRNGLVPLIPGPWGRGRRKLKKNHFFEKRNGLVPHIPGPRGRGRRTAGFRALNLCALYLYTNLNM